MERCNLLGESSDPETMVARKASKGEYFPPIIRRDAKTGPREVTKFEPEFLVVNLGSGRPAAVRPPPPDILPPFGCFSFGCSHARLRVWALLSVVCGFVTRRGLSTLQTSTVKPFFKHSAFPIENREAWGEAQSPAAMRSHLVQFKKEGFTSALSDFHLLLYMARTYDIQVM